MNLNQIINLVVRTVIVQTVRLLVNRMFGLFSRRGASHVAAIPPTQTGAETLPDAAPTEQVAHNDDPVAEARRLRREAALARRMIP